MKKFKNWKTTTCGALIAVGMYLSQQEDAMLKLIGQGLVVIAPIIFGLVAKDHNVTGGTKEQ